jgi:hypothetical protein
MPRTLNNQVVDDVPAIRALLFHREKYRVFLPPPVNDFYSYEEANTDADDGDLVLKPTNVLGNDPGRWVRVRFTADDLLPGESPTAAVFVVKKDGSGDFTTIQAALDALGAGGGDVYVGPGTFTEQLTMPDKHVTLTGSGAGITNINLGATVGAAVTIAFDRRYVFRDFTIQSDGVVGSIGFEWTVVIFCEEIVRFVNVTTGFFQTGGTVEKPPETALKATAGSFPCITGFDAEFWVTDTATSWSIDGAFIALGLYRCQVRSLARTLGGGTRNAPFIMMFGGILGVPQNGVELAGSGSVLSGVDILGNSAAPKGTLTLAGTRGHRIVDCYWRGNIEIVVTVPSCSVRGNTDRPLGGTQPVRRIDVLAAGVDCDVSNNRITETTAEGIRIASTGCTVSPGLQSTVLETGAANSNEYTDIAPASTIIGDQSRIDSTSVRNVKAFGATGDGVTDDSAAIQAAADAIPDTGGVLYFPEGTYAIETGIVLPSSRNITIKGACRTDTLLITTSAITMFTCPSNLGYVFEDITLFGPSLGTTSVGVSFSVDLTTALAVFNRCDLFAFDTMVDLVGGTVNSLGKGLSVIDCTWDTFSGGITIDAGAADSQVTLMGSSFTEFQLVGDPDVNAHACEFTYDDAEFSVGHGEFVNCRFAQQGGCLGVLVTTTAPTRRSTKFVGCSFDSQVNSTRFIDLIAVDGAVVVGCHFDGTNVTGKAIRTTGDGGNIANNTGTCDVLESGSSDGNLYSNNQGFGGSTIIGAASRVDGVRAGASASIAEAIGKDALELTEVGNVGVGEDDLIVRSLPANALDKDNSAIRITAMGIAANNGNAKTLRLKFGTTTILTVSLTVSQAGFWEITAIVGKTGASTQDFYARLLESPGSTRTRPRSTSS